MSTSSKSTKILPVENPEILTAETVAPVSAVVAKTTAPVVAPRFAASVETPSTVAPFVAPKSRRWAWVGASAMGLLVVAAGGSYGAYSSWKAQQRIAPGLIIQGVPVGGLTLGEARARLKQKFATAQVVFATPKQPYRVALRQMGGEIQFDRALQNAYWFGRSGALPSNVWKVWGSRSKPQRVPLAIRWNKPRLRSEMNRIATQFQEKATPARLEMGEAGLNVVHDIPGRTINAGATLTSLQKQFYVGTFKPIKATIKPVLADVRASDLAGRDVALGFYTTSFNAGEWGRTRNIYIAAAAIDGRVFMPGEEFSFNKCTGQRTWDKGYRMAHIFERKPGASQSEVVDGLAGGVCQVSTTAYNAVRRANNRLIERIQIVERNYHSLPVTYVSSGMDATVAWPHKDFRFANTLSHPIYLRATVSGSRLRVAVWGRISDKTLSPFESEKSGDGATDSRRQAFNF